MYLGRGYVESLRQVDYKKQEKLEVGDDLSSLPAHVAGEYMDIEKAPVVMSLKDANAVGVVGDAHSLYSMMKNMTGLYANAQNGLLEIMVNMGFLSVVSLIVTVFWSFKNTLKTD